MLVERILLENGCPAYILDGDNLRHGLNADLGFSMADRAENLRRLAHVASLMADAGLTVLVPAISPLAEHRHLARGCTPTPASSSLRSSSIRHWWIVSAATPRASRARARRGEITHFTGIDSPYQRPKNPDLRLTPTHRGGIGPTGGRHADAPGVSRPSSPGVSRPPSPELSPEMTGDHELAARLAQDAGPAAAGGRAELAEAPAAERKAAGDARSHDFLMQALAVARPGTRCSPKRGRRPGAIESRSGVDRRPTGRDSGVLRGRARRLGGACRALAGRRVGGRRGGAARAGITLATPRSHRPAATRGAADPGVADPSAGRRAAGHGIPEWGVATDGLGGRQGRRGGSGPRGGVRARRWSVRVGLGAPVAVAPQRAYTSRIDGTPLRYNRADPLLPDLVVCRPEYADAVLAALR